MGGFSRFVPGWREGIDGASGCTYPTTSLPANRIQGSTRGMGCVSAQPAHDVHLDPRLVEFISADPVASAAVSHPDEGLSLLPHALRAGHTSAGALFGLAVLLHL